MAEEEADRKATKEKQRQEEHAARVEKLRLLRLKEKREAEIKLENGLTNLKEAFKDEKPGTMNNAVDELKAILLKDVTEHDKRDDIEIIFSKIVSMYLHNYYNKTGKKKNIENIALKLLSKYLP